MIPSKLRCGTTDISNKKEIITEEERKKKNRENGQSMLFPFKSNLYWHLDHSGRGSEWEEVAIPHAHSASEYSFYYSD